MSKENPVYTRQDLIEMQKWPLDRKIMVTQTRLIEFYQHFEGKVYVAFSGGKDSTVLLHIARKLYPGIKAAYFDTGLEYPEIREFVKSWDNVDIIRYEKTFVDVVSEYGYPVVTKETSRNIYYGRMGKDWALKHLQGLDRFGNESSFNRTHKRWAYLLDAPFLVSDKCCEYLKKRPARLYQKRTGLKQITGMMASESSLRREMYLRNGCNSFEGGHIGSTPMGFWTEQDILEYLFRYEVPIASVYGKVVHDDKFKYRTTGVSRTGCMFCLFGVHLEKHPNRFEQMKLTHPKVYEWCTQGGHYDQDGLLKPDKSGLGLGKILEYIGVDY